MYTGSQLALNSMTLNDLERQNRGYYGIFWWFRAASQVYIIHKVAPRNYRYAIQIENWVFVHHLSMNQNCYRLSCVLWALAQIFCRSQCLSYYDNTRIPEQAENPCSEIAWCELVVAVLVYGKLAAYLVIQLYHWASEGMNTRLIAPHRVTGQLLLQNRHQIRAVDDL